MSRREFSKQFLKHPREIGSFIPTSKWAAEALADIDHLKTAKVIVELGPGTGVVTEKILQNKPKQALFFAIEINKAFVEATKKRFPGIIVYHDSAEYLEKYLYLHGVESCDVIISALPWATFHLNLQDRLLQCIGSALPEGGTFLTIAHVTGLWLPTARQFARKLPRYFREIHAKPIVWKNVPPACIYVCKK